MNENDGRSTSGGDRPAATTTSAETKVEVDRATGDAVAEDSRQAGGNEGPVDPAPATKKVQFTGKVRRGLALMRMVQMAAQSEDCPSIPTFVDRWSAAQKSDYNAALAWMEQEEDWDSVSEAWDRGRFGKRGGK